MKKSKFVLEKIGFVFLRIFFCPPSSFIIYSSKQKTISFFIILSFRSELGFIRSQFRGQLPKHYKSSINGTRLREKHFNDANREEQDRYVR